MIQHLIALKQEIPKGFHVSVHTDVGSAVSGMNSLDCHIHKITHEDRLDDETLLRTIAVQEMNGNYQTVKDLIAKSKEVLDG